MGDSILQIQVLNNIGLVHGQDGDSKKCEEYLLKAGKIHNEQFTGEAFQVSVLPKDRSIEYRRSSNVQENEKLEILGHINVPNQLTDLFDKNPNEAIGKARKLMSLVGDIESNLAINLLNENELDKAEKRFQYAMESYSDLNDGPKIAQTFANFGVIARRRGHTKIACDWWRRSISVYQKLNEVDNKDGRDILWAHAIHDLEETIKNQGVKEQIDQ